MAINFDVTADAVLANLKPGRPAWTPSAGPLSSLVEVPQPTSIGTFGESNVVNRASDSGLNTLAASTVARQISLSPSTVVENARRVTIGELSVNDAAPGDILIYTVTDKRFAVDGNTLQLAKNFLNFETTPTLNLTVTVTDQDGNVTVQQVPITVLDVNEAPIFLTGPIAITVKEGTTSIATYQGSDPDAGSILSYSITGGTDAGAFTINATTGLLAFATPRDFELRNDFNRDNVYNVQVTVSDGVLSAFQDVRVEIHDVQEPTDRQAFRARIDFAPSGSEIAEHFLTDTGKAYNAADGYGWVTEASVADGPRSTVPDAIFPYAGAVADRPDATGLIDPRLRTYAHFEFPDAPAGSAQAWAWEFKVENGVYLVRVAIGDLGGPNDSNHVLNVEGITLLDGFRPSTFLKTVLVTGVVTVTDGRVTLDSIGGDNTKIQSIRIEELVDIDRGVPDIADFAYLAAPVAVTGGEDPVDLELGVGIDPNSAFSIGIVVVDPLDPVDRDTINTTTVRLVETLTNIRVDGTVNSDAAGGTITFQPLAPLKENTSYTLVIDGIETVSGREVISDSAGFATGLDPSGEPTDVAFARQELDVSASTPYSSIVISPDGNYLYATSLAGTITRWQIDDETGVLTNEQVFAPPELAGRALIGIVFDPEDSDVFWITNNDPLGRADADDFTGKISRVTLDNGTAFNATVEDYIVGLPRSVRDHLSNSLAFHQDEAGDWKLYMTQGSNSATGAADNSWSNRPERLLTAAVLEIDPRRDVSGGPIDVQTQDPDVVLPSGAGAQVGFYNPFAANAPVQLFATGVRNAYDLVWHSNGHLYVPTNGSAASGNTPDDPNTPVDESLTGVGAQNDYLFDVLEGFYYGHPNPVRGEYILNGGNPTAGDDGPGEVATDPRYPGYPVGVTPPSNYGGYAYNFSQGRSPNGAVEYLSSAFGDLLQNALLVVEYSGGTDIVAIRFDSQGRVIENSDSPFVLGDAAGNPLRFANPLDLATDTETGRIYVVQLSGDGGAITLLTPTERNDEPLPPRILEAEVAAILGARVSTSAQNFSGTGYVDFRARSDESITWSFNIAQAGMYEIGLRFALPLNDRNAGGRPLTLMVNGEFEATLPFVPTEATFNDWLTILREVEFQIGANTITLTSIGQSGPNIDYLQIAAQPDSVINTRPTIAGSQADVSFVAGAPVSFVLDDVRTDDLDPFDVASLQARLVGGGALPRWLDFDSGTNQFSSNSLEVPAPGIYEIEILASDGQDASIGRVTFSIEIVRAVDPVDVDGDGTANAADADDDNDGVADIRDPFQADPSNGQATPVTEGRRLVFDFEDRPFGADPGYALGITGFHLSNGRTPEALGLGSPNLTIGDGVLHIENAGSGDLPTDDLIYGAQFGIDPIARFIRISATFDHPFDTRAPARGANFGLLIGTGDADNYVKLVLEGKDANGAFLQMETVQNGVRSTAGSPSFGRTTASLYRQADADDTVTFTYDLDTVLGTLTASWSIRNGAALITGTGPTITLTGDLLAAVQGDHTILGAGGVEVDSGLSVGVVASSRGTNPPLDIDVLEIVVEGLVADPDVTLVSGDSPLLGSRGVFNFIRNPAENTGPPGANPPREYKDIAVITVRNDGTDTLHVSRSELTGPFRFVNAADAAAFSLEAGQTRDIEVQFDSRANIYDPEVDPELFKGELRVFSDDPDETVIVSDLAGFYQTVPEGGQEPNFNELMEIFGFGTRADLARFDNFDLYRAAGPDEVLSPYWEIAAGYSEVTVTQLAAFHDISQAAIFIYEPGNGVDEESLAIMSHNNVYNQALLPQLNNGTQPTVTFDAAEIPDQWTDNDVFGFRVARQYSDPSLNTPNNDPNAPTGEQRGHFLRIFVAKDEAGNVIADTYIVAQDYQGINYDYQDNLYLVRGISAVDDPLIA